MTHLKLYVFGPPRLEHDGQMIDLNLRKAQALVVYLAVTNQPQSRDTLATLFWPDSDQREARASLRRTLYRLGQALDGDILDITSDTVSLNPQADFWLDSAAFEQHVTAGLSAEHPPGAVSPTILMHLTAAAELYTDDFLAGFTLSDSPAFDEWQFFQRESLRQSFAQVLEKLVYAHQTQGALERAIPYARRWLALDPLHEPAQRQLMQLYAWAGQPAAALRQYQECVRLLDAELGVAPEDATTALYEAIRAKRLAPPRAETRAIPQVAATPVPDAIASPAPPTRTEPVHAVGREAELAQLHRCLDTALGGTRQLVFVTGEPGMGKTTLVDTFLMEARRSAPLLIGHGQCLERWGEGEAYMPVLEALGRLCREPGGQAVIALLAQRAPTWLVQMPGLVSAEELAALQHSVLGTTRERMLREMVETLDIVATERAFVLVLEDLHWSDYSTLDLLAWLARRQEPARLLVIGTYRPADVQASGHPLHATVQELRIRGYCAELALAFLSAVAVEAYLAARFPEAKFPAGLAPLLHQRTEGNPLFMVNVVDAWVAQGLLAQVEREWTLQAGLDQLAVGVPESLRQLIELQLDQLDHEDCAILEAASVTGIIFAAAAVAAAVDHAEEAVETRCDALARHGQFLQEHGIAEWPDGTVAAQYGFIHHLYQEVLYERIPAGRQVRLHRQIGTRIEAGYDGRAHEIASDLAVHFVRGRDAQRAVQYLQVAAEQALQRSAHREAIAQLKAGLEIVPNIPDPLERARYELTLQITLAPALIATEGWGSRAAEQAYKRAHELCNQFADSPQHNHILLGLATMLEFRAEYQQSQALMEQRLSLPNNPQAGDNLIESYDLLACSLFHQGNFAQSLDQADYGLKLYNPEQQYALIAAFGEDPGVGCHIWASLSLWFLGYPDQALERAHLALRLAHDHLYGLANAQVQLACIHQCRREEQPTRQWAELAIALATAQGFPYRVAVGTMLRGWALAAQGQPEAGIAQLRTGLAACRASGALIDYPYFLALLAETFGRVGQFEEGFVALSGAMAIVRSSRAFFYEAELHRLKGVLLLQADPRANDAEAEANFWQALDVARRQQAKALELRAATSLCRLWQQQGKVNAARALLADVYDWFTEGFETLDLREAQALLAKLGDTRFVGQS